MTTDTEEKKNGKVKKRVKVKKSALGRGVFARQDFREDAVIGEITGEIMGSDHESNYCMDLECEAILEPASPFRFLNHSCEPNCELLLWKQRRINGRKVRRIWLMAARDVVAGEELTIDYAWPADVAVPCLCGTKECRGWVVDEDELPTLLEMGPRQCTPK